MLKLVQTRIFIGRNIHCDYAAIAGHLEITAARGVPFPIDIFDLQKRLVSALNEFATFEDGAETGERLTAGDTDLALARLVGWLAAQLQNLAGAKIERHGISLRRAGELVALSGFESRPSATSAMRLACEILASVMTNPDRAASWALDAPLKDQVDKLVTVGRTRHIDSGTRAIVNAARARNIPAYRLSPVGRFTQLGQGVRQRRIFEALSDNTSATGNMISRDKRVTHDLLIRLGIAVPRQIWISDFKQALLAAERIGYPVVVKPSHGLQGKGVTVDIRDAQELKVAYDEAVAAGFGQVLVESHIPGDDHRLLVIGGRFVAGAKRIRAHVIGNGKDNLQSLIDAHNADMQRRGPRYKATPIDNEVKRLLRHQGYDLSDVPEAGKVVYLKSLGAYSRGGATIDVTHSVHPEARALAENATRALGLKTAGVDYITEDVTKSPRETGGAICEVNGAPALAPHWAAGEDRGAIANPALDQLFAPHETARIPIVAITGSAGKTTTTRMVAAIFTATGKCTAVACSDGVTIGDRVAHEGDCAGGEWPTTALLDPCSEAAVFELARGGLIRKGILIDTCDVAAVLNVESEHIGQDGIRTIGELAAVKSMLLALATRYVVLNADNIHCVGMAPLAGDKPICWVTERPLTPLVNKHLKAGGLAFTTVGSGGATEIVALKGGDAPLSILRAADIPATWGGALKANVTNALFAAAIAYTMDIAVADIRNGLHGFRSDLGTNPGRFNLIRGGRYSLLLDQAGAPYDMDALCGLIGHIPVEGRKILVMTRAGDRRDDDIREFARRAAGNFDHYVCYSWNDLRGRRIEEIPALLAAGLEMGGVRSEQISIIPQQDEAMAHAASVAGQGDLLTVISFEKNSALQNILKRISP